MKLSRRAVAGAVVGAPVWALAASVARLGSLFGSREARAAQEPAPSPTPEPEDSALGRFLARDEEGLTGEERRKVRKQVAQWRSDAMTRDPGRIDGSARRGKR